MDCHKARFTLGPTPRDNKNKENVPTIYVKLCHRRTDIGTLLADDQSFSLALPLMVTSKILNMSNNRSQPIRGVFGLLDKSL